MKFSYRNDSMGSVDSDSSSNSGSDSDSDHEAGHEQTSSDRSSFRDLFDDESSVFNLKLDKVQNVQEHESTKGTVFYNLRDSATQSQSLMGLVDRLRSLGIQHDIDLPIIATIGLQSSGKSSLIEGLSGLSLPRSSGTCTRCPFEIRLRQKESPWRCKISLVFAFNAQGEALGRPSIVSFGAPISDPSLVEDRLTRAQMAILSPPERHERFLIGPKYNSSTFRFSKNYVSIEVEGPNVPDLSFYDLPGLITNSKDGSSKDIELIEELLVSYIKKPSCLILLTMSCESDFLTQGSYRLVKEYDQNGSRTIGVLTKPDRIQEGDEPSWIKFITHEEESQSVGWFCVKQPSTMELKEKNVQEVVRAKEREFFEETSPWKDIPEKYRKNLGTQGVSDCLYKSLVRLSAESIPLLLEKVNRALLNKEAEIKSLPAPISGDPLSGMMRLVTGFCDEVNRHSIGVPEEKSVLHKINMKQDDFRRRILSVAPIFNPWRESEAPGDMGTMAPCVFLDDEEVDTNAAQHALTMHLDEVLFLLKNSRTRELPGYYPNEVTRQLIIKSMRTWLSSAQSYFDDVQYIVRDKLRDISEEFFKHFDRNGLLSAVQEILYNKLKEHCDATSSHLKWLLALEEQPNTQNIRLYNQHLEKFTTHFKGVRFNITHSSPYEFIRSHKSERGQNYVGQVISTLGSMGMSNVNPNDLLKLIEDDGSQPAIHVMASTSAYYQVSCKRFVDNVIMAVDHDFVTGISRDLQDTIYTSLTKGDGMKTCKNYLKESEDLARRRKILQERFSSLEMARKELLKM